MPSPAAGRPDGQDLLEVGRITKAHGLRGEVIVFLSSDREERVAPGSELHTDDGLLVVQASRRHQDRWLVTFAGISTREGAEAVRGTVLRAEPIHDPEGLWLHDLLGCTVATPDGVARGVIESLMDNPANDLLVLDTGALVPVVFIVGPPVDGVLTVDTPDGLFDLLD